jgi:hypothetical protein
MITEITEVVLSLLIEKFDFKLGKEEIEWLRAGIQIPVIKGKDDYIPRLPMKVSLVGA